MGESWPPLWRCRSPGARAGATGSRSKFDAAEAHHRRALAIWRSALGERHPTVAFALHGLGRVLIDQGRAEAALPVLREALDLRLVAMDSTSPTVALTQRDLGTCLLRLGRYDEAEPLLRGSYPVIRAHWGEEHKATQEARAEIARLERRGG